MNCTDCQAKLPSLLFEPSPTGSTPFSVHLSDCVACQTELASLRATFSLLDEWSAPEPSRVLRSEARCPPPRSPGEPGCRLVGSAFAPISSSTPATSSDRPLPALSRLFCLSAGAPSPTSPAPSTASRCRPRPPCRISRSSTRNDQAIQTMDQLLQEESAPDDTSTTPTS